MAPTAATAEADGFTANVAQQILAQDERNILRSIAKGKPLTASQRAALIAKAHNMPANTPATVSSILELAAILGASRRSLSTWQKLPGAPKANPNGTHDVAAWVKFKADNGLKPDADRPDATNAGPTRKEKREDLENRKLEIEIGILEGNFFEKVVVAQNVQKMIAAARYMLLRLPQAMKHQLVGLDSVKIEEKLRRAVLEVAKELSSTPWARLLERDCPCGRFCVNPLSDSCGIELPPPAQAPPAIEQPPAPPPAVVENPATVPPTPPPTPSEQRTPTEQSPAAAEAPLQPQPDPQPEPPAGRVYVLHQPPEAAAQDAPPEPDAMPAPAIEQKLATEPPQ